MRKRSPKPNEGMNMLALVWVSLRPKQWTKNLFVFAGILFSQNLLNASLLLKTVAAFIIFCVLSGAMYIINDLTDLEQDRDHPVKSRRPIASGKLERDQAVLTAIILVPISLALSYCVAPSLFLVSLAYFLLQLSYSFALKHIVILDVFAIACGFVLRVVAGGVVVAAEISPWILICTILLSLFLALNKRRHELVALGESAKTYRQVLAEYSPYFLDQMIAAVSASTVVAYALYTVSDETVKKFGTQNLVFTIPFVLYGIFRYQYLVHQKGEGGSPESMLVSDVPLLVDVFLWVLAVGIVLYKG
jgi:4-hydroxybenzoate polyprenyltransferase